jgi:hypothetical protein
MVRAGDEGSQAVAVDVLRPSVEYLGILKVLTFGLGACGLGRKKSSDGGDAEQE